MDYQDFLRTKGRKAVECGFEWKGTNPKLFDWQNDVVRRSTGTRGARCWC